MNEFMSKSFGSQKKKNLLFDSQSFKKKKNVLQMCVCLT